MLRRSPHLGPGDCCRVPLTGSDQSDGSEKDRTDYYYLR
jgi:hypothetical protein